MSLIGHLFGAISVSRHVHYTSALPTLHLGARLYIGIDFALPATCLCIARRLYGIAAVRNAVITRADVCHTCPA